MDAEQLILIQVQTLETAQMEEYTGKPNLCLEMKMLHAIHMAVNGTKLGIIQVFENVAYYFVRKLNN